MVALLAALSLLPAPFARTPGWHVGNGRVHACPGVSASRCVAATSWASTIRWRGCGECLPHRTIAALPPDGIALQVTVTVERPLVARQALTWPPTIRARDVGAGFEGISRRYGVYQLFARFGRREAIVWAFFGRARPTAAQLRAANAELRSVHPAAANPWQLRCPAMQAEQSLPRPLRNAALRFFPWVKPPTGLHAGPIYLVALSSGTRISRDGDRHDSADYYLHRALIAVAPTYTGAVTISGHRLGLRGRRTSLGFSTDGATRCTVKSPIVSCGTRSLRFATALHIPARSGWRIVRTELRIGRTGCFRLTATGNALHRTIPLAVPGPDYGTPGW